MKKKTMMTIATGALLLLAACSTNGNESTSDSPSVKSSQISAGEQGPDSSSNTERATITLRAYAQNPEKDPDTQGVYKFADLVSEYTDGAIEVEVYPAGQLGNAPSAIQQVQNGSIDFIDTGISYFVTLVPDLAGIQLPYLFDKEADAYAALDGPLFEYFEPRLADQGLQLLSFPQIGYRSLTTKDTAVHSAADLNGLKIRTLPDDLQVAFWEKLGAKPTPLDFNELYTALSTGTVDGQENPPASIVASQFYEVQKYLIMTKHVYTPALLAISKSRFDGLDAGLQDAIKRAARDAVAWQRELSQQAQDDAMKKMSGLGMTVIDDVDLTGFKAAAPGIYDQWRATHGIDFLNALGVK